MSKVKSLFIGDADDQATAYRNLRDGEWNTYHREFAEALWVKYEPHAEPVFRDVLSREFHQRYWEMYLCCGLLNMGLEPESQSVAGPDFKIRTPNGKVVWLEATVPTSGTGDDAVPDTVYGQVENVPTEQILLRFRSGIEDKSRRFSCYLKKGIVSENDFTVIAINGSSVSHYPFSETDPPGILSALFPLGDRFVTLNRNSCDTVDAGFLIREHLTKKSGSKVPTTLFTSKEYAHISAVLSCNSNAGNHPDTADDIGSDFTLIYNPYAQNPLPRGLLPCGREFLVENDHVVCYMRDA